MGGVTLGPKAGVMQMGSTVQAGSAPAKFKVRIVAAAGHGVGLLVGLPRLCNLTGSWFGIPVVPACCHHWQLSANDLRVPMLRPRPACRPSLAGSLCAWWRAAGCGAGCTERWSSRWGAGVRLLLGGWRRGWEGGGGWSCGLSLTLLRLAAGSPASLTPHSTD